MGTHIETNDPRIHHTGTTMLTEASTLEFPPGVWQNEFRTKDGHLFDKLKDEYEQGELVAVKYVDRCTKGILTIFND